MRMTNLVRAMRSVKSISSTKSMRSLQSIQGSKMSSCLPKSQQATFSSLSSSLSTGYNTPLTAQSVPTAKYNMVTYRSSLNTSMAVATAVAVSALGSKPLQQVAGAGIGLISVAKEDGSEEDIDRI